jgi:nucleotide-binding universal stress UspA family protein
VELPGVFNSVVIAADVRAGRDRAMPVGTALALRGQLPVEMLTIGSPDGSLDIGAEIVVRLQNRDGALLVMATDGVGLISKSRRGISGHVLSELRQPVLLVGPEVHDPLPLASPTLVVCIDRSQEIGPALPVVEAWQRTFGGGRPRVVEVRPTTGWPADAGDEEIERQLVEAAAAVLAEHGIDTDTDVLHGGDIARYLLEFAEQVDDAVIAVTSDRWPGGHSHWYSTTRRLVQRSPGPVLVIPTDLPGY